MYSFISTHLFASLQNTVRTDQLQFPEGKGNPQSHFVCSVCLYQRLAKATDVLNSLFEQKRPPHFCKI